MKRATCLWLVAVFSLPSLLIAQQQEPENLEFKRLKTLYANRANAAVANRRQSFMKFFGGVISDMERICTLSDAQSKKLEVAAKGAVEPWLESYRDSLIRSYDLQLARRFQRNPQVRIPTVRTGTSTISVYSHPRWLKAISNVLSEEQRVLYDIAVEERKKFQQDSLIRLVVAEIDCKVMLTASQRAQLVPLVAEQIKQIPPVSPGQTIVSSFSRTALPRLHYISKEKITAILDEVQLSAWNEFVGRQRKVAPPAQRAAVARPPVLPVPPVRRPNRE